MVEYIKEDNKFKEVRKRELTAAQVLEIKAQYTKIKESYQARITEIDAMISKINAFISAQKISE